MSNILKWVVFALVAYACWNVGPVYVHSRQFEERLEETARQNHDAPQPAIVQRTMELAASLDIPLEPQGITVRQAERHAYVDATYTADLQFLPGVSVPWTFTASVDGYVLRQTVSDVIDQLP